MRIILPAIFLLGCGAASFAQDAVKPLPALNFYSSIAADEMFEMVKGNAQFARVEQNLYGSPVTLRITHSLQPTAGGKATSLLSAIWSGGTLGLLPVVTNNNFVVRYDLRVQGHDIATYTYQRTFTRAVNIWSQDKTYGLGEDGLEWLKSTAQQFAADVADDAALADLQREYEFYFGT